MRRCCNCGCLIVLAFVAVSYWLSANRNYREAVDLRLESVVSYGTDKGLGNIVGIEPWIKPADYASQTALTGKLDGYLAEAKNRGLLRENTVVVLPEYIGTWLVAANEHPYVYKAPNLKAAMAVIILTHPVDFTKAYLQSNERDRITAAIFRMKSAVMLEAYRNTFFMLSIKYGVPIIAGSIVLPRAEASTGRLRARGGPLNNISVMYNSDGSLYPALVEKRYPTADEIGFTAASRNPLPIFETKAGRIGALICADAWYPDCYTDLAKERPDVLVVPSYGGSPGAWSRPWNGYSGHAAPKDVDMSDVNKLTEAEAWRKYATLGRYRSAGVRDALNIFMRGNMWGMHGDAQTMIVSGDKAYSRDIGEGGAAIVNLWRSGTETPKKP